MNHQKPLLLLSLPLLLLLDPLMDQRALELDRATRATATTGG